ncbi:MAG: hypothetical protein C4516_04670 [Oxalobacter sp.]|nr:MAG: hypothetical protein C4516_04670 [Oxalobacter sp.]
MKKMVTMLILSLSAVGTSAAYAQVSCMKACEESERQCIVKNSKIDIWGNRVMKPEGEKACQESSNACRRSCVEQMKGN